MSAMTVSAAALSSRASVARRPAARQAHARAAAPRLNVVAVTKKNTAPPPASRFGAKKAAAPEPPAASSSVAYVCGQCGYIYSNAKAFDAQPSSYKCPVCKAPKAAFEEKDTAGVSALLPVVAALVLAAAGAGVFLSKL